MEMAIATIKKRFKILPTPKKLSKRKKVREMDPIKPRLVLANIKENVKRRVVKKRMKNTGIIKNVSGSTK